MATINKLILNYNKKGENMRKGAYFDEYYIEFEGEGKDFVVVTHDGKSEIVATEVGQPIKECILYRVIPMGCDIEPMLKKIHDHENVLGLPDGVIELKIVSPKFM